MEPWATIEPEVQKRQRTQILTNFINQAFSLCLCFSASPYIFFLHCSGTAAKHPHFSRVSRAPSGQVKSFRRALVWLLLPNGFLGHEISHSLPWKTPPCAWPGKSTRGQKRKAVKLRFYHLTSSRTCYSTFSLVMCFPFFPLPFFLGSLLVAANENKEMPIQWAPKRTKRKQSITPPDERRLCIIQYLRPDHLPWSHLGKCQGDESLLLWNTVRVYGAICGLLKCGWWAATGGAG